MSHYRSPRPASPEQLYALLRRIRPLNRMLVRVIEHHLAGSGITRPMRAILECLEERGPQTVPQLARTLAVRRQFAQRVVNELVETGLVERRANAAHKRSWLIAATPAGSRVFAELREREWRQLEQVAAGIDRERLEQCVQLLDHLTEQACTLTGDSDPEPPVSSWPRVDEAGSDAAGD